ncbi:HPF/RaiA family ribosome-associated protein [Azospirillum halopraeferens]|uniref:HPF/RaiA family ribosome-associated protein n=1 Tax=Azospirillum halopraeferens TaxID=34010 RepID=UPI0003FC2946|nr:HPF/RaiA family ribosome-associated protein [Azospirillum halopraeferens]
MQLPLQISFRNMHASDALAYKIRQKAAKLDRLCGRLTRCDVVVEAPHHDRRKGRLYHVRIDMTVPGGELVVRGDQCNASENVHVAVRNAFDAARRRLDDWARRRRETSVPAAPMMAAE